MLVPSLPNPEMTQLDPLNEPDVATGIMLLARLFVPLNLRRATSLG